MLLVFGLISVLFIVGGYLLLRIETLEKSDAEMKRDLNVRASELYVENVDHKLQKQLNEQKARQMIYNDRLTQYIDSLLLADSKIKATQNDLYNQMQVIKEQFEMSKNSSKQVGVLESKKQKKTKKPAKAKRKRASK